MSKTNKSNKFLKLVGQHQDKKKEEKFLGVLSEYLLVIEKDPQAAQLA